MKKKKDFWKLKVWAAEEVKIISSENKLEKVKEFRQKLCTYRRINTSFNL